MPEKNPRTLRKRLPTIAVIIPTIATKRTKQKISREQEVRLWSKMVRQVITNCVQSVQRTGFSPAIVIVNNFSSENPEHARQRKNQIEYELNRLPSPIRKQVHIIERPGAGWMGSIIEGGAFAINSLHANAVVSMADDFETEAKQIGRLLEPLKRKDADKRADFTFARTKRFTHSFPPAQFLKERIGSLLVSFANPRFKMRPNEGFLPAALRSERELHDTQSQSGLMAMNARTFREGHEFILQHFSGANFGHSGLDPVMMLSALRNPKNKMEGVDFPRRFEHFDPRSQKEQQSLVASRTKFFEGAISAVRQFLTVSGQTEKIHALGQAQHVIDQLAATAPRTWTRFRKIKDELATNMPKGEAYLTNVRKTAKITQKIWKRERIKRHGVH